MSAVSAVSSCSMSPLQDDEVHMLHGMAVHDQIWVGSERINQAKEAEQNKLLLSLLKQSELRDMSYSSDLCDTWISCLAQQCKQPLIQQNMSYLVDGLVPTLFSSLIALQSVIEREHELDRVHYIAMKHNPLLKPRPKFNPIHWIATYLIRHNPKYNKNNDGLSTAYSSRVNTIVQDFRSQSKS